jgi:benzodiazapine receptor
MILRVLIFLIINSAALGIGGIFTNSGVTSSWYLDLTKAPWTPAGWVFGVVWTSIMVLLAIYMAYLYKRVKNKSLLITLFTIQFILNVIWNPIFFYFQDVKLGLLTISSLTVLIGWFILFYRKKMRAKSLLLLPYFVWLLIATSLNAYILINN